MTPEDALKRNIFELESQLRDARIKIKDLGESNNNYAKAVDDLLNMRGDIAPIDIQEVIYRYALGKARK